LLKVISGQSSSQALSRIRSISSDVSMFAPSLLVT
jgi:hypothetical protein